MAINGLWKVSVICDSDSIKKRFIICNSKLLNLIPSLSSFQSQMRTLDLVLKSKKLNFIHKKGYRKFKVQIID